MRGNNSGITLLEVLVAMGISIFIFGAIAALMMVSFKSNKIVWEQLSTQNEGRKATQDFINELRTAAASSVGAYPLESVGPQQIIFFSNIDIDPLRERLRYFKDGTNLKKGVIKPSGNPFTYNPAVETVTIVAHDIANGNNPVFYYYGQNYTGQADNFLPAPVNILQVRMVKITLDLEEDPRASPVPFHIEAKGEIRNLKTN